MVYFFHDHWGDLASVTGVAVALVGFVVTYRAARRAEDAATRARARMLHVDTVAELAQVKAGMTEIMRLHRARDWAVLPDRYQAMREHLATIRSAAPGLSDEQKSAIQSVIVQLDAVERSLYGRLAQGQEPDVAEWNIIVGGQIVRLVDLLAAVKLNAGEQP